MKLLVGALESPSPACLPLEIVERKGLGHPDTICDALAENLSRALSRFYLERFGAILHHNVDKALLCGGAARPAFGGGEITEPIDIYLAGRATASFEGVTIPVDEIAVEQSRRWLRENLRHLDPARQVRIHPRIRPTSPDLAALFLRQRGAAAPLANDTSLGVGFAPLDALESAVLAVERKLNAPEVKAARPEIGEDVKVMGVRSGRDLTLTVACALVGRHVSDIDDYRRKKARIRDLAAAAAGAGAEVEVNSADGDGADSIYLTVTGLSAEAGDDGQVGRGNRVNGLITPYRPMSLEAAAGKNPVTHVGKLYNLLANRIARALVAEVNGVQEAYCYLVSRIGQPITEPQLIDLKLRLDDPAALASLRPCIEGLARRELAGLTLLWRELLQAPQQVW
ncbi:MAG TPA: methionine adenosyltransferase [Burkholderiales bacterium]|nr:methionine adenosyltransferase [Burkholderiales bacterium]